MAKKKRKALSADWADVYAAPEEVEKETEAAQPEKKVQTSAKAKRTPKKKQPSETEKSKKVRAVFYMPEPLLQEARNAVLHLAGFPEYLNLAKLAEQSIRRELDRLKKKHLNGEEFPALTDGPLKGGRPLAS